MDDLFLMIMISKSQNIVEQVTGLKGGGEGEAKSQPTSVSIQNAVDKTTLKNIVERHIPILKPIQKQIIIL